MESESLKIHHCELSMINMHIQICTVTVKLYRAVTVHVLSELLCNVRISFSGRLRSEKWMNVQVGDIIKLENNQFVTVSTLFLLFLISLLFIMNLLL